MDRQKGTRVSCGTSQNMVLDRCPIIAGVNQLDEHFAFPVSFSDHRVVKEHVIEASVWQYLTPVRKQFPLISCCKSVSLN